ncbi:MAG TPA: hypothetical protein VHR45_24300 [Thermoanaerobaculia bacterium]|nr:hypothetical protein [Thermoanaerobaculia bacterium]
MALAFAFSPASMNAKQYDECIRQLAAAGAGAPAGRLYHACYGDGDKLRVFDIWESKEHFDRFGEILKPILERLGVDPGQPDVQTVHRVIKG